MFFNSAKLQLKNNAWPCALLDLSMACMISCPSSLLWTGTKVAPLGAQTKEGIHDETNAIRRKSLNALGEGANDEGNMSCAGKLRRAFLATSPSCTSE